MPSPSRPAVRGVVQLLQLLAAIIMATTPACLGNHDRNGNDIGTFMASLRRHQQKSRHELISEWVMEHPDKSNATDKKLAKKQAQQVKAAIDAPDNETMVDMFATFVTVFKKNYTDEAQTEAAYNAFYANMAQITDTNLDDEVEFVAGVNPYSDMDWATFSATVLTMTAPPNASAAKSSSVDAAEVEAGRKLLRSGRKLQAPTAVNWVTAGKTTPVRNQGSCGCCWAFAATTATESALLLSGRINTSPANIGLSQQELVDCVNPSTGFSGKGCNGGWPATAFDYIAKYGVVTAGLSPYLTRTTTTTCPSRYLTTDMPTSTNNKGVKLNGGSRSVSPANNREALKAAVAVQPVAFAYMVSPSFQSYRSGIYNPRDCTTAPNHAMVVVGYDAAAGYWLVQNSWGTGWGESGFVKIVMNGDGPGACGMYQSGMYPSKDFAVVPSAWSGSSSTSSCSSTQVASNAWCCSSVGAYNVANTNTECANYCKSKGSVAPFCYDFNPTTKHCECSKGRDSACSVAQGYSTYTYSCTTSGR